LRFALITTQAGVPGTLATTAFIGAFADGLARIGMPARVVALTVASDGCDPKSLAPTEVTTPWVLPAPPSVADIVSAAAHGILDGTTSGQRTYDGQTLDWYLELLLQRDLAAFAGDDDLTVLFYLRKLSLLDIVARVCARCGYRLVMQSSEALIDAQIDPSTREAFVARVVNDTAGTWALSEYLGEYWQNQGVPRERLIVSPNVVRESSFHTDSPPRADSAVYIGNLKHREIDYLLEVSAAVSSRVPGYCLSVYGDATAERRAEIMTLIGKRGLQGVVVLKDPVLPQQVPDVLATGDVLVLPRAKGEFSAAGFPNKLGEYLASGRPVVVTRVGDIPNYLADRESAFLVAPDDCDAFSAALVEALGNQALADRVGAAGQAVARNLLASGMVAGRVAGFAQELPVRPSVRSGAGVRLSRIKRAAAEISDAKVPRIRERLGGLRRRLRGRG